MLIGAHIGSDPDFGKMFDYAHSVGCECIQMFLRSPRMWSAPPLPPKRLDSLLEARKKGRSLPIMTHTSYLINLATDKEENINLSVDSLSDELWKGEQVGAYAINTHVGSSALTRRESVAERIADRIVMAYERSGIADPSSRLVLENSAGSGRTFGKTITELAWICEALEGRGVPIPGICIDTAHAWAAGYDVATQEGWDRILEEVDSAVGIENLVMIHANDSLVERGSLRDRHAWIGEGKIGYEGFRVMTTDKRLTDVTVVIEMPGETPVKDERNITVLKMMRDTGCMPDQMVLDTFPSNRDDGDA